jgi:hypothetical protein
MAPAPPRRRAHGNPTPNTPQTMADPTPTLAQPDAQPSLADLARRVAALEEKLGRSTPSPPPSPFEILDVDGRVMGRDPDGLVRFSWRIVVRSLHPLPFAVRARIQFLDMHSFVLRELHQPDLVCEPVDRQKFSGLITVSPEEADQIMGIKGRLFLS